MCIRDRANIRNALVGRLPGLTAVQKSGEPGNDQSIIRIRGIGSFAGSYDSDLQNPLVMVDGIEVANYNNCLLYTSSYFRRLFGPRFTVNTR